MTTHSGILFKEGLIRCEMLGARGVRHSDNFIGL